MSVTSVSFIFSVFISAIIYYLINPKFRNYFLGFISCLFIANLGYLLLLYIILFSFFNFYLGKRLAKSHRNTKTYWTGISFNVMQLIILRYSTFLIDPVFILLKSDARPSQLSEILIPVGISYFTLQGIGYLTNIRMGWEKPERSFSDFLLYIVFFPKFLSGPIERSNHFLPQLKIPVVFSDMNLVGGLRTILFGLFKKVAIANELAPFVSGAYLNMGDNSGAKFWVILLLQPLYLYFDFSGYTDIAIGFSRMFGIDLLPNFNRPFLSTSMTNFWKRFHISLSSWFNDYIFRQVSFRFRRLGITASVMGLLITWTLFGIWHGAGWTFMLLGILQAMAIIYEFFTKRIRAKAFSGIPGFYSVWIGRISVYLFYCFALLFFFAPNINSVIIFISKILEFNFTVSLDGISTLPFMVAVYIPVFMFFEIIHEDNPALFGKFLRILTEDNKYRYLRWSLYSLMITILFVAGLKEQQFVYANF